MPDTDGGGEAAGAAVVGRAAAPVPQGRALVIGVGNRDRGDDAVGPVICDHIDAGAVCDVDTLVFEGSVLDLALHWGPADRVVIVDAAAPAGRPGRIIEIDGLADQLAPPAAVTTHTIDVGAGIELARVLGRLPAELTIIGVEGDRFDHGLPLSATVRVAVADVVALVERRLSGP